MSNPDQFEQIMQKIDTLTKIVAGILLREEKTKTQKIEVLTNLGITNKEIVQIVGGTESTVSTLKTRVNKKGSSKGGKSTGKD
jgi:hypothetical protein